VPVTRAAHTELQGVSAHQATATSSVTALCSEGTQSYVHRTALHCAVLHCTAMYGIVPHYSMLYVIIVLLHCSTLLQHFPLRDSHPTLNLIIPYVLHSQPYVRPHRKCRECDPDLCKACGVSVHPMSVQSLVESAPKFRMCCNSSIRRHVYKKTRVGRSTINGWGTFLLEAAKRNDFIMEYTGEGCKGETASVF
jgi:hypothetical protein